MITGVWMNEETGAQRLLVQLDEDQLVLVDFQHDPVSSENVTTMELTGWVEMSPR
jgi:hypothetical protein